MRPRIQTEPPPSIDSYHLKIETRTLAAISFQVALTSDAIRKGLSKAGLSARREKSMRVTVDEP